jgi:hypothetical protein
MVDLGAVGTATAVPKSRARTRDPIVILLAGAVVVLLLVSIALGTMLVAPRVTASPATAQVDRMIAAWNEFDEATIRSVYADDAFIFASSESTPSASGIEEVVSLARWGAFTIERLGHVAEHASLRYFPVHISTAYDVQGDVAVVVLEVRDGKIAQHWVVWGTE